MYHHSGSSEYEVVTGLNLDIDSLKVSTRGKESPAEVTKMPFVPNTYFKEPTAALYTGHAQD